METDHSKAGDELKALAKKNNLPFNAVILKDDQKKIDDLNALDGTKFDKEYINAMVDDHKADIKDFEDASGKVKNADLKAWIDKTLPTLKNHLQAAEKIQKETKNMSDK
jgi:putative membrane protein